MEYYQALKVFNELCYSEENCVNYRLEAGDCVVFDNLRVLHGRDGFSVEAGNTRHLAGCYVDWDEIHDKINVISGAKLLWQHIWTGVLLESINEVSCSNIFQCPGLLLLSQKYFSE